MGHDRGSPFDELRVTRLVSTPRSCASCTRADRRIQRTHCHVLTVMLSLSKHGPRSWLDRIVMLSLSKHGPRSWLTLRRAQGDAVGLDAGSCAPSHASGSPHSTYPLSCTHCHAELVEAWATIVAHPSTSSG